MILYSTVQRLLRTSQPANWRVGTGSRLAWPFSSLVVVVLRSTHWKCAPMRATHLQLQLAATLRLFLYYSVAVEREKKGKVFTMSQKKVTSLGTLPSTQERQQGFPTQSNSVVDTNHVVHAFGQSRPFVRGSALLQVTLTEWLFFSSLRARAVVQGGNGVRVMPLCDSLANVRTS